MGFRLLISCIISTPRSSVLGKGNLVFWGAAKYSASNSSGSHQAGLCSFMPVALDLQSTETKSFEFNEN